MPNFYIPIKTQPTQFVIVKAKDAAVAWDICLRMAPLSHGPRELVEQTTRKPTV